MIIHAATVTCGGRAGVLDGSLTPSIAPCGRSAGCIIGGPADPRCRRHSSRGQDGGMTLPGSRGPVRRRRRTATPDAAGCSSRRCRWGCGRTSATTGRRRRQRAILRRAFDRGVTHFDLANNYGPPYGRAEENFGRWMREDFAPYRDELVISTKAGLRHVAGAVRPGRRVAEVRARLARPVAGADGAGVRRHLLQPPVRPRHAAGGDDGGARHRGAVGPRALRRHLVVLRGRRPRRPRRSPASSGRRC